MAVALVPEEKVSFSLYGLSVSTLTVAKIRKVYNKLDSKAIAKQVRPSSDSHGSIPFKGSRLADIENTLSSLGGHLMKPPKIIPKSCRNVAKEPRSDG